MSALSPDPVVGAWRVHRARVSLALELAAEHQAGLSREELGFLTPRELLPAAADTMGWLRDSPELAQIVADRAYSTRRRVSRQRESETQARARAFLGAADQLWKTALAPLSSWVLCVAVTGSAAYGTAGARDDCDFFVVTRDGAAWGFLALAFLLLRIRKGLPGPEAPSRWCLNYLVEDHSAEGEFRRPQGFLVAREALMAKVLRGGRYYRALLSGASWMKEELPVLFDRWGPLPSEAPPPRRRVSLPVRWFNWAVYPVTAAYLHLQRLRRNHRFRREGQFEHLFRIETARHRYVVRSEKFDRLRQVFDDRSVRRRAASPSGDGPFLPTSGLW